MEQKPILRASSSYILEGIGVHVAAHGQMMPRRRQVLTNGEHVDAVFTHVAHHLQDLFIGLAKPTMMPLLVGTPVPLP